MGAFFARLLGCERRLDRLRREFDAITVQFARRSSNWLN